MSSKTNRAPVLLSAIAVFCAACAALSGQAPIIIQRPPQTAPPAPKPLTTSDIIERVKSGDYSGVGLDMIARANATEAIPALEEQFAHAQDTEPKVQTLDAKVPAVDLKNHIASVLVRLGDRNEVYWDFLTENATRAVESDAPDIQHYDQEGKPFSDPSPAFVAWAESHHLSLEAAEEQGAHDLSAVIFLAETGDPRAVPLLRRGLLSSDYYIEAYAAQGLAEAKDADSVPLIVEACRRAPPAWKGGIAQWLVYFDDPDAQRAVDQYVPKDLARDLRAEHAKGKTPFS